MQFVHVPFIKCYNYTNYCTGLQKIMTKVRKFLVAESYQTSMELYLLYRPVLYLRPLWFRILLPYPLLSLYVLQ